jgi:hypothetical protein
MKDLIKKLLREGLDEAEFNYHVGNLGDDLKNVKPYVSDNLIVMQGRGTGHFGSGVYFSTYNCGDKRDFSKEYGEVEPNKSELIRFDNIYRVDFDIYQNLFRVKSEQHGEILFKTLKLINESFYLVVSHHNGKFEMDKKFSNFYLKIQHNANELGLKIPNYRDYIKMIQKAAEDLKNKSNLASMSTRIMEYNGFNGVNVSGIPMFDNTLHGSVIYDLSKISDKPIPVKNPSFFCNIKHNVVGDILDTKTRLLRGEEVSIDDILKLPKNLQIIAIKRSEYYFNPFNLDKIGDDLKKVYYRSLQQKLQNNVFKNFPKRYELEKIVEDGYINIIYDPNIKIDDVTFLEDTLDVLWRFNDKVQQQIINGINRKLTPEEEMAYKNAIEDIG